MRKLQPTIGNTAVTRLLVQAKLRVGPARDRFEREADRIADDVLRQPVATHSPAAAGPGRAPGSDVESDVHRPIHDVARSAEDGAGFEGGTLDIAAEQQIRGARSGGSPLPEPLRRSLESTLAADLGAVRVHQGDEADTLNRSMQSRAFTVGNDIFFARGQYSPADPRGRHLLAHELVHTVQQGASGVRRRTEPVVQRYVLLNPGDYTLGLGSKLETQEVVVAGGTGKFVHKTRARAAVGTLDTVEEGVGAGAWNKTATNVPSNAGLPQMKYGTDGTNAIALEATTGEAKVFYATPQVIANGNTQLESVKAEARLADAGGLLRAPANPANPAGAKLNLRMVKPGKAQNAGPPTVLERFGDISECNSFIKYIIGTESERVAVFGAGAGHEARAAEEKEPTPSIANFAVNQPGGGAQALAQHLTTTGTVEERHDQPLPNAYKTMVNKQARDAALGINAGAEAEVGEGYVITQGAPMPGDVTLRAWLDALDNQIAGLALNPAEQDMLKQKWGYHYAGVVAKVGHDAITLENYNRGTQQQWVLDDLYKEQIDNVVGLRNALEAMAAAGKTIPSIPKLRNDWFRTRRAELDALGATANADQQAARTALKQVEDAIKGLEIGAGSLWHFKMYGTGAGQSFHEQWQGALDDPTTLRIRQSNDLAKVGYEQRLEDAAEELEDEKPSNPAAVELAKIDMTVIPALRSATTSRAIGAAFRSGGTTIATAAVTAMHDWAVNAAQLMDKKPAVVPKAPSSADRLQYRGTLVALIQGWESKGWAVRPSAKAALGLRKSSLAEYRRKIGVAATVNP